MSAARVTSHTHLPLLGPSAALLLGLALVLRLGALFAVVWFLLGLLVVSRLWSRHAVARLSVSRRHAERAFLGDEVSVDLVVRNAGHLPIPWLEADESVPAELAAVDVPREALSLGSGREKRFTYRLLCRRRGEHVLGPLHIQTGDPLGIQERYATIRGSGSIVVYPRVVPLQRLGLPTRSVQMTQPSQHSLLEDTSRIHGIRDYRSGDSLRRVHWSATARTGRLMVKQFQPSITREVLIAIDLHVGSYPMEARRAVEQAIVVGASLANHIAIVEDLPVGITAEGRDPISGGALRIVHRPASGRAHLTQILESLARVQPASSQNLADWLQEATLDLSWGATLVVVTGRQESRLTETARRLRRRGLALALIIVQPNTAPVVSPGLPVYHVWTDADLEIL